MSRTNVAQVMGSSATHSGFFTRCSTKTSAYMCRRTSRMSPAAVGWLRVKASPGPSGCAGRRTCMEIGAQNKPEPRGRLKIVEFVNGCGARVEPARRPARRHLLHQLLQREEKPKHQLVVFCDLLFGSLCPAPLLRTTRWSGEQCAHVARRCSRPAVRLASQPAHLVEEKVASSVEDLRSGCGRVRAHSHCVRRACAAGQANIRRKSAETFGAAAIHVHFHVRRFFNING